MQVKFTDFQIEETNDYLTIRNGFNQSAAEIVTLTDSLALPLEYVSDQSHYMSVKFVADGSGVAKGFSTTFISTARQSIDPYLNCQSYRETNFLIRTCLHKIENRDTYERYK